MKRFHLNVLVFYFACVMAKSYLNPNCAIPLVCRLGSYQYGSSATQAGATQFQYPPFNVGDHGTWSNSNNGK